MLTSSLPHSSFRVAKTNLCPNISVSCSSDEVSRIFTSLSIKTDIEYQYLGSWLLIVNGKLLWWLGSWFWFYLYFSWLTSCATVSSILPINVFLFSNERFDSEFLEEFSKIEFCFSTSDSLFCSLIYSSLQFKIQMEFQICFLRNFDYLFTEPFIIIQIIIWINIP